MMKYDEREFKLIRVYPETKDILDKIGKRKEYQADVFHRIVRYYAENHKEELD